MRQIITLFTTFLFIPFVYSQNIIPIATARGLSDGTEVTVKAIVTSGPSLDPSSGHSRFFQDNTGGLSSYDANGTFLAGLMPGDSIIIRGEMSEFFRLKQLSPVNDVQIISTGNPLPAPRNLSLTDALDAANESRLVRISDIGFSATGTFAGQTNYNISDPSGSGQLRVNGNSDMVGEEIPIGLVNVSGIVGRFNSTFQLLPSSMSDFDYGLGPLFTKMPEQENIGTNAFDLVFESELAVGSAVRWGSSENLSDGFLINTTAGKQHIFTIPSLSPGSFYYAQALLFDGTDTSYSPIGFYSTKSLSSGKIKVYFNSPVDTSASIGTNANYVGTSIVDSIIALVNSAKSTADFALYNWNNAGINSIAPAINAAFARGVRVRMITDAGTATFGFNDLNPSIPRLQSRTGQAYGLMHNKFVVIDVEDSDPNIPVVWTGSTNWTKENLERDPNNVIVFQDQALARAFTIEFEEMWGSNGPQPSISNAKFGPDKTDNTPKKFMCGDDLVELYFSPSDGTEDAILKQLAAANDDIEIGTMLMTRMTYADLIYDKVNADKVYAAVIMNDTTNQSSRPPYRRMAEALNPGQKLFIYNKTGTFHHKYAIVDQSRWWLKPATITGSHNWSAGANTRNDENTVIVHSASVTNQFFQEWLWHYKEMGGIDYLMPDKEAPIGYLKHSPKASLIKLYPNPGNDLIFIDFNGIEKTSNAQLKIFDLQGRLLQEERLESPQQSIEVSRLSAGSYLLQIINAQDTYGMKWLKIE